MDVSQGNRKAVLLVFLVFVLGICLGAVGTYVVTTRVLAAHGQMAARSPANRIAMLTRNLNLTPTQQEQIQAILNDTRTRYAEIHKRDDPEYDRARQEGRDRIRQVLTPEQGPKFEELLLKMDAERSRRQGEGRD